MTTDHLEVTKTKRRLRCYAHGARKVYRVSVFVKSLDREVDVVLKIGLGDWCSGLRKEANIYSFLKSTQGQYIPYFWGMYTGRVRERPCVVLVLEDCGDELKVPVYQQPFDFRYAHLLGAHACVILA